MGPGFFEDFLTTENTLRKPAGASEHNMYNFAYNLYMLIYLKATSQLKEHVLQRTLQHMDTCKCPRQKTHIFKEPGINVTISMQSFVNKKNVLREI